MADEVEVPADTQGDQMEAEAPITDTPVVAATPAQADDPFDRPFINPDQLPDEVKPHWKAMHRAHNKKLDEIRAHKADLDMLAKFRSDPTFARELLQFEATRLGVSLPASPAAPQAAVSSTPDGPTPELVAAVQARLDPSLHWMAPSLAAAGMEAAKLATKPLVEKDRAKDQAARDNEWSALSGKLTESAPGWEAHETDMSALLDWLKSPAMNHPQFGDKLSFLYNAVTNGSAAKAAAIREMSSAARNATRTGQSSRATLPNVTARVRQAVNQHEALQIAAEEAMRELRQNGHAIPD